ncbi:MAG: hypothetical protein H6695_10370 [Deferribacteres bacterium]|nr:hypothetical protein [candidate division KSB1 bacterium]MCB9510578.1 hypothetical protein [Deferribacteres bacterium]
MNRKQILSLALFCATVLAFQSTLLGQIEPKSAGIGFRGTYWDMNNEGSFVTVRTWPHRTYVDVGNGGFWLYFYSRLDDNTFLEFSLGAVGRVESETRSFNSEETNISAIFPVVMGWRHMLVGPYSRGALQPYVSLGGGAYWLANINAYHDDFADEVTVVDSELKSGGYLGAGLNFMLSSSFGINFDAKKHFIAFNKKHPYSGWEYGLGLNFSWGDYKKGRRRRR